MGEDLRWQWSSDGLFSLSKLPTPPSGEPARQVCLMTDSLTHELMINSQMSQKCTNQNQMAAKPLPHHSTVLGWTFNQEAVGQQLCMDDVKELADARITVAR